MIQALLNHVVTVQILDQFHDATLQCFDDGVDLLRRIDEFDHFLKCPSAVAIEGNLHHLGCCVIYKDRTLVVGRVLKQLLAKIIAKGIFQSQQMIRLS